MIQLKSDFYKKDPITVAKSLLGKIIVHKLPHGEVSGRITFSTTTILVRTPVCLNKNCHYSPYNESSTVI